MNEEERLSDFWIGGGLNRVCETRDDVTFSGDRNLFRNFYRAENKKLSKDKLKKLRITDQHAPDKLVTQIFDKVKHYLIEHRSGVYLKGMGYFFVYRTPMVWSKRAIRFRCKPLRYMPMFLPTVKDRDFWGWSMDFTFNHKIQKAITDKINDKYRYLNMYGALNNDLSIMKLGYKPANINKKQSEKKKAYYRLDENGNYIFDRKRVSSYLCGFYIKNRK